MSDLAEIEQAILDWFKAKSVGGKTKYYLKDVTKALEEKGFNKKDVQKAVTECIKKEKLMYWSSGSSTMLVLPEHFPKSVT
ncbi:MAG: dissimilatory sulfite reductase D family protein [Dehalococcoidia bacterium]